MKGGDLGPAITPGKPDEPPDQGRALRGRRPADAPEGQAPESRDRAADAVGGDGAHRTREPAPPRPPAGAGSTSSAAAQFWAFRPPRRPAGPRGPRRVLGPDAARPLHPGRAGGEGLATRPGGRQADPDPPGDLRPDRPAAHPRGGRRVPRRRRPDAFARVVDRLLASPHYGERWGRHWLDVARYADSNGLDENVAHGNAWRYRDYVIAAFNADKPYDRFVLEQLAGDLLPADADDGRDARAADRDRLPRAGAEGAGRGRRDGRWRWTSSTSRSTRSAAPSWA